MSLLAPTELHCTCPLSGHHSAVYLCLLLTQSACTAECSLRFIGIPLRRPCAASLQRCQRNSFGAPARSRTCSQGARPPQTLSPCSWLVLQSWPTSPAFSQRLSLAKQGGAGKRSQLMNEWGPVGRYWRNASQFVVEQTRSCLQMSACGGKADILFLRCECPLLTQSGHLSCPAIW
jgi:hypothetical protein